MSSTSPTLSRRALWTRLLLYPGHTLPTAAAPVLVGVGLAWRDGVFAPWPALWFLLGSWLVHVTGVFADNHTLVRRYPELPEHPELLAAVANRTLTLSTLVMAIRLCLVLAGLCAVALLVRSGPMVLVLALVGLVSALGYHWGPWPYANHGLADPIFFLMFGVVAVAATYGVQAASLLPDGPWWQRWPALPLSAWIVGMPVGGLVTCVLIIDDIRDRHWDAQKGWRTPPVRWGVGFSRAEFAGLLALAYLAPFVALLLGAGPWALLPLLTAPQAWQALRAVRHHDDTPSLFAWTPRVARLGLVYAVLQAAGLMLPALI